MDLGLSQKVALITAASKGIGYAIAEGLAAEGCNVIITSSDPVNLEVARKKLSDRHGVHVTAHLMDHRNSASVIQSINTIIDANPSIDILIINGPGPKPMEAKELAGPVLHAAVETTLISAVELCHRVLPKMIASGYGRIVFVASSTAKEPDAGMVLSNVTRAAVVAYAKSLSREVAKHGITVNSILTGSVLTDRSNELLKFEAAQAEIPLERFLEEVAISIPAGYICSPSEFARAIIFLCSPEAAYVNGVSLPIDGGYMRTL